MNAKSKTKRIILLEEDYIMSPDYEFEVKLGEVGSAVLVVNDNFKNFTTNSSTLLSWTVGAALLRWSSKSLTTLHQLSPTKILYPRGKYLAKEN